MNRPESDNDIQMDVSNLYREETFTDNAVGTLRRLVPVTAAGEPDTSRAVQYIGSTQVLTNAGPLPLSFEIEAGSLQEAATNLAARPKMRSSDHGGTARTAAAAGLSIVIPKGGMGGGMGVARVACWAAARSACPEAAA
jgi:hypothetical protein